MSAHSFTAGLRDPPCLRHGPRRPPQGDRRGASSRSWSSTGGDVTTRQIAEAAGIAEGTIFRVFADKRALILAAAESVMNPAGGREAMARTLAGLDGLEARVVAVVERLGRAWSSRCSVMMALRCGPDGRARTGIVRRGPSRPAGLRGEGPGASCSPTSPRCCSHRTPTSSRVPPGRAALVLRSLSSAPGTRACRWPTTRSPPPRSRTRSSRRRPRREAADAAPTPAHPPRPYRAWLGAVVVLQFVGMLAMLYLPSLNADIIDNGVATGDTGYIVRTGAADARPSRWSRSSARSTAVWFCARTAMGFGRDLRAALFHRVGSFSQREVQQFGAPSLITREHQRRPAGADAGADGLHDAVSAPIMMVGGVLMALREDAGLGWILAVVVPALVPLGRARRQPDGAELPADAGAHRRGQPGAARADHRHPRGARVRPRAARDAALRRRQRRPHRGRGPGRPLDGHDVPAGDAGRERLQRRGASGSAGTGSTAGRCRSGR